MQEPIPDHACRTLVVVLSMHRSGSSLTMRVLQRLGMSLGPFPLIGPLESNRHGHFEPEPINDFDMRLQQRIFAFTGDIPRSEEVLGRLLRSEGRWGADAAVSDEELQFGRETIRQLVQSGPVSGFKDPRVILLWPYWQEVLRGFPQVRIVLLTLLRSPHELAMSMFMRGQGQYTYYDALEVTAVNLQRLQEISNHWSDQQVLVRFDPRCYPHDLRRAAEVCNLSWRDDAFQELYDPADRHYDPTRVEHRAQRLFDELVRFTADGDEKSDALRLAGDAAVREKFIQSQAMHCVSAVAQLQAAGDSARADAARHARELARLNQELSALATDVRAEFQRLQRAEEEQRRTIECLERRLHTQENHPAWNAVRRLYTIYGRFRRQVSRYKAA